jgi:hypothetical protein
VSPSGPQQNRDHPPRTEQPTHHSRPRPDLGATDDLSSLAAALSFPGCTTRLDAAAAPPQLILCHPYVSGPQRITADGFFCWDHPAGLTRFSPRRAPIGQAAAVASVLLSYLIIEHADHQHEGTR